MTWAQRRLCLLLCVCLSGCLRAGFPIAQGDAAVDAFGGLDAPADTTDATLGIDALIDVTTVETSIVDLAVPDTQDFGPGCASPDDSGASLPAMQLGPASFACGGALRTQCQAREFCSPGWRVCNAFQAIELGADTAPIVPDDRWLNACLGSFDLSVVVRVGSPCPTCQASGGVPETYIDGPCGQPDGIMSNHPQALSTSSQCRSVGLLGSQLPTEAFWHAHDSDTQLGGAICCHQACDSGSFSRQRFADGRMTLCQRLNDIPVDQCEASQLCGPDAHICTLSEYLVYGGVTEQPAATAWLAGCMRETQSVVPVAETVCSSCTNQPPKFQAIGKDCTGLQGSNLINSTTTVGVVASNAERQRLLASTHSHCAWWRGRPTPAKLIGTMCCVN